MLAIVKETQSKGVKKEAPEKSLLEQIKAQAHIQKETSPGPRFFSHYALNSRSEFDVQQPCVEI